jgi:hypothetical protein
MQWCNWLSLAIFKALQLFKSGYCNGYIHAADQAKEYQRIFVDDLDDFGDEKMTAELHT